MMMKLKSEDPHPVDIAVGKRIAARRSDLGYSQGDLGRALNLTFQQIQKYEKGTNRISASKLWEAANFLDIDIAQLFTGLGDRPEASREAAPTRFSVEAGKLLPELAIDDQKTILNLVRRLHEG